MRFDKYFKENKKKYWKMAQFKLALSGREPPIDEGRKKKIIYHQAQQIAREDYEIIHKIC